MKFYDTIDLPNPDRVKIALAEKGVLDQVEVIQVNLWEGEHRTAGRAACAFAKDILKGR